METADSTISDQQQIALRLHQLVDALPPERQRALLKLIESDNLEAKRKSRRKSCFIIANYTCGGVKRSDIIQNISVSGVFIETREDFQVGQEIVMTIGSGMRQGIKIVGEVARVTPTGIGVEFKRKQPSGKELALI